VGIPTLIHWPAGLPQGERRKVPGSTLDLLQTCCAAMEVDPPGSRPLDGTNLLPLLQEENAERGKPIPYRFLCGKDAMFHSPTYAVTDENWKFLTNLDAEGAYDQLYDMETDRGETQNLIADYPDLQKHYRSYLEDFLDSCRASHSSEDYDEIVDMVTPFQEERGWSV